MYWTIQRWASLLIHGALAIVLLAWSISSAFHFWDMAFADDIYAYGAIICIDGLAFLGLVLYIFRVESPLVHARHILPIASAVPLVFDMHNQFAHFENGLTWVFTVSITLLLVALSFVVWTTIERLFVQPEEAAREYAKQQMQSFNTRATQLQVMQQEADGFVAMHMQRAMETAQRAFVQQPTLAMETHPRLGAAPMEPVLVAMESIGAPMENDGASTDRLEITADHPEFTYNTTQYKCSRCGSVNEAAGKNARSLRQSSGRYGCQACK